jgi:hypothetical protein
MTFSVFGRIRWRPLVVGSLASGLLQTFSVAPAFAQRANPANVTIRVYDVFGVGAHALETAEFTVRALFDTAGIDVRWRACRLGRKARAGDSVCDDLVGPELMMRIVKTPPAMTDTSVLGFSYVETKTRRGVLGTVFADRTEAVAAALGVPRGMLLGRAIAHEIGHLLLGTTDHPSGGLMRGRWSLHGGLGEWLFSDNEAQHMREALAHRRDHGEAAALALKY